MQFILWWILIAGITVSAIITIMAIWFYLDRRNVPEGFDEACSKIDQELDEQGK